MGACLKLDVGKAYKRLNQRQQLEYTAQSMIVKSLKFLINILMDLKF